MNHKDIMNLFWPEGECGTMMSNSEMGLILVAKDMAYSWGS